MQVRAQYGDGRTDPGECRKWTSGNASILYPKGQGHILPMRIKVTKTMPSPRGQLVPIMRQSFLFPKYGAVKALSKPASRCVSRWKGGQSRRDVTCSAAHMISRTFDDTLVSWHTKTPDVLISYSWAVISSVAPIEIVCKSHIQNPIQQCPVDDPRGEKICMLDHSQWQISLGM